MPIYLQFYFWLVAISALCFFIERLSPWRKEQEVLREEVTQDAFWLLFNSQFVGWMIALAAVHIVAWVDRVFIGVGLPTPESLRLVSAWPLWTQFVVMFVVKDFIDWNIHRMLHTIPWLWHFHKLHHSARELDWLVAFRSHWGEIIIQRFISYLPLVILGTNPIVVFIVLVVAVLIQELTHANIRVDWGPLRYLINSPRYHSWHHDVKMYGKGGQNFAVNLAVWDWLFGTAYWPDDQEQPENYGFHGMKKYPKSLAGRILYPIIKLKK